MAGSEAEWVTIANNLLLKCHIHLRIHELEDCDANVFIALYQSILGEKVPDLIVIPKSQEDEAHNVQAVIDSLALDYLQVSLSHITGENIVKGDKESIRNLLEIFDGLLEYLTEHISEASHEKCETELDFEVSHGNELLEAPGSTRNSKSWKRVSFGRCSLSSEVSGPSWDGDEIGSAGELIRLGDTAHTFSLRSNGAQDLNEMESQKDAFTESHFKSPEEVSKPPSSSFLSKTRTSFFEDDSPSVDVIPSARKLGEPIRPAIPLQPPYQPSESRAPCPIGKEYLLSSYCSPDMNHTEEGTELSVEPDSRVLLTSKLTKDSQQEINPAKPQGPRTRKLPKGKRYENKTWDSPISHMPTKRFTGQELHAVSEKLSQRLCELDQMLKSALGDQVKVKTDYEENIGSEETLSQHSDSVMECGPKKRRPGLARHRRPSHRSYSLSPSPVNKHKQIHLDRKRQQKPKETDTRRFQAKAITEAFERELRRNKIQDNIGLLEINEEEETDKIYKEAVHKRTPKYSQPWKIYSRKTTTQSPRSGLPKSNKAVPMQINEHGLLPLMLERLPFLYVSGQTLTKMWKQQMAHIEQLKKDARGDKHSKKKFQDEIEEALRRHDLLTALVKKEYEHSKRLIFKKLFEDGLQIQKQRLRDLRNYAKEKRNEQKRHHQDELDSMENYYKDQFSLLAEAISQERQEIRAREKSQAQTLNQVKRELRSKMEKEIQQLQYLITQNDDDAFFRELEAERFRSRLHLASFQYSKNPFP
ncbi:centrosomal protein of 95 kDa isoform X2 [Erinaceus europaeus]|uniref:Centrosomal protein of 95 kDa isoform X2 n=1 Tax=Erinaceus europaeus TaxID=9365 RepID=A0ABM3YBU9_ERIEU|nr:centrosomal protein of 95 kDa isoform X2 [Erinaceus europaeus]